MEQHAGEEHLFSDPYTEQLTGMGQLQAPNSLLPTVLANLGLGNERLPKGSSLETILIALNDPTWQVRAAAIRALSDYQEHAPVALLERALHDAEWRVRVSAVQVLGTIGAQAPVDLLALAARDEDRSVRAAAAQALGKLGARAPVDLLLAALDDPEWLVRETAAIALGGLGKRVPVEPLKSAARDSNEFVRESALLALMQTHSDVVSETPSYPHQETTAQQQRSSSPAGIVNVFTGFLRRNTMVQARQMPSPKGKGRALINWGGSRGWRQAVSRRPVFLRAVESGLAVMLVVGMLISWLALAAHLRPVTPGHHGHLGSTVFTYQGGQNLEGYPVWSDDSHYMAFLSSFGFSVQVWDASTGKLAQKALEPIPYSGLNTASGATWSPDGRYLAITSEDTSSRDGMVQVWDGVTGRNTMTYQSRADGLLYTAWSPDGNLLAMVGDDGIVHIWDPLLGKQLRYFASHPDQGHSLSWSADNQLLLVGTPDGTFQLWNATTGASISAFFGTTLSFFALSPDGRHMVSLGQNGMLQAQNTVTGGASFTRQGPVGGASFIEWSSDGEHIFVASAKEVQEWDALTGHTLLSFPYISSSDTWQLSPDSRRLFTSNDSEVQFWNAVMGHTMLTIPDLSSSGTWQLSPNGDYIAYVGAGNSIRVLDADSGRAITTYQGDAGSVEVLSWSPDSRRIASASKDRTVQVWDATNGSNLVTYHTLSNVVTLSWSPDGHYISATSEDNTLSVLQAAQ